MTYSIVARDADTGELGVAVQTCNFAVGSVVPWARAGVGAVATQAMGDPAYGPRGLDAMARGEDANAALAAAIAADEGAALRQVGMIDASGRAAAFTGDLCIKYAGHHVGDGYAVHANMMASPDVWPAMAAAYESARGPFAERLLATLVAAEGAGGDARGGMSAALLVVDGDRHDREPQPVAVVDLRVDDHERPLDELARLLHTRNAFVHFGRGTDALFSGNTDLALRELDDAQALLPGDENIQFARAGALIMSGRLAEAQEITRRLVRARPSWATIIRGFEENAMLAMPPGVDVESFLGGQPGAGA